MINLLRRKADPGHIEDQERDFEYFISLGAGQNQIPLIKAAKELGFRVIAVDRDLNAPGNQLADIKVQCSLKRPAKIRSLLEENLTGGKIKGVGTRSFGRVNISAAALAHYFEASGAGCKHLRYFSDKRNSREFFADLGVQMPHYFDWSDRVGEEKLRHAEPPLVARPARGHAKQGIQVLDTPQAISEFLLHHGRENNRWLVESLLDAREVTVMGFVYEGLFQTVCITDKIVTPARANPPFIEIKHIYPSRISDGTRDAISIQMQKIVNGTGMHTGPMVAEFLVPTNGHAIGEPFLVECAPETGGEYLADVLIPALCREPLNYFHDLVRLYTGSQAMDCTRSLEADYRVMIRFIAPRKGKLKSIDFHPSIARNRDVLFHKLLKKPGDTIDLSRGNHDRLAVFGIRRPIQEDPRNIESIANQIIAEMTVAYESEP